jgi:hypothetical protein
MHLLSVMNPELLTNNMAMHWYDKEVGGGIPLLYFLIVLVEYLLLLVSYRFLFRLRVFFPYLFVIILIGNIFTFILGVFTEEGLGFHIPASTVEDKLFVYFLFSVVGEFMVALLFVWFYWLFKKGMIQKKKGEMVRVSIPHLVIYSLAGATICNVGSYVMLYLIVIEDLPLDKLCFF